MQMRVRCVSGDGDDASSFRYEGGIFTAILKFPSDFPNNPPEMRPECLSSRKGEGLRGDASCHGRVGLAQPLFDFQ